MSDKSNELTFQNDIIDQMIVNGWMLGKPEGYNRELALYEEDVIGFVQDTPDTDSATEVHTAGLSEGTADQLYLALRLAAIDLHLDKHPPIPLILDDLLMTFDDDRTRTLLSVLEELSQKTQIIIFTHHSHLTDLTKEVSTEIQQLQLSA